MNRSHFVIGMSVLILSALLILLLTFLFNPRQPNSARGNASTSPTEIASSQEPKLLDQPRNEHIRDLAEAINSILSTPITFYGKVVDQYGNPVPHASVSYGLLDKFNESGSVGKSSADGSGHFTISDVRGAVISVSVYKNGYYQIEDLSKGSFSYGYGPDSTTQPPPTKNDPAAFVLHRMGETEPLIVIEKRSFRIPKNGTPVMVDLATGNVSETGQLKIEAWTSDPISGGHRFYDWRCRVSVPGGGLTERNEQFEFEAPSEGYREYDEIVMMGNEPEWEKRFEKDYFLRLPDNTYARIKFSFTSAGDHYSRIETFLNPRSGSRNLEYNPQNTVDALR